MKNDFKTKFRELFEKIKKVKHIQIYLATGLALLLCIIYFATIKLSSNVSISDSTQEIDNVSTTFSNSAEYIDFLENKLENVITKVKGASDVEVIITLEKGFEYVYATEEETKSTSNGTTITSSTIIMVDGKPVIKEEIYPIVKGIVVIAKGVENINVKMDILSIIQTVVEVDNSRINIFAGE